MELMIDFTENMKTVYINNTKILRKKQTVLSDKLKLALPINSVNVLYLIF